MFSGETAEARRFKFLPLSVRLETRGGIATPLVLRGTPLPAKRLDVFTTATDNQTSVEVHVLIGESPLAKRCVSLGRFHVNGIQPAPGGKPQIRVVFEVDDRCTVHVTANVEGTTLEDSKDLIPDLKHLTDEAIKQLRADSERFQEEDQRQVSLIEATHSAEAAIRKAEDRLASDDSKGVQGTHGKAIAKHIAAVGQALETEDVDRIRECTRLLEASLSPSQSFDFTTLFGSDPLFGNLFTAPPARPVRSSPATEKSRTGPPPRRVQHRQVPPKFVARAVPSHVPLGRIFGGGDFTLDPNLCFVLMPLAETFQPIYDDHIRPVIQSEGLTCLRADEIRGTSLITRDIWEKINRARFLIADLTGQNPNVFYEVGLAHALSKDVLLLTQTMTDVPFDLKAMRCVVYSYTPRGMKEMEEALRATVSALMKSG